MTRRKPYTTRGISRMPLHRARLRQAFALQWRACAAGLWRPLCEKHDVQRNRAMARFVLGRTRQAEPIRQRLR